MEDFGVARLALIPVRQSAGSVLQLSQLLFGDVYQVIERSKDKLWLRIKIDFDGTEGWIHRMHHHSISPDYYDQISQADFKITLDLVSTLLYKKSPLSILLGSIVPISSSELFKMDEQFAFNGNAKSISQKRDSDFVRMCAMKYLNAPEMEGGKSPFGISNSNFVQMVFKIAGWQVPSSISAQLNSGKKIKDVSDSASGDLAFFKDKKGNIDHVGIILEENKIIHVAGQVRIDHLNEEGILNAESKIYSHSLAHIRRIISL